MLFNFCRGVQIHCHVDKAIRRVMQDYVDIIIVCEFCYVGSNIEERLEGLD